MQWFSDFIEADEKEIDFACCVILRTLFKFLETAMHSDDDVSFEKLYRDYFVKGEEFNQLIEETLPEKLAGTRRRQMRG